MSEYIFKMPDLGEGTVDAEIVAWHAKPGDTVTEDQLMVEVMTDKAAVEVPAPVSGRVVSVSGAPGDKIAVGSPLAVFEVGEAGNEAAPAAAAASVTNSAAPLSSVGAASAASAAKPAAAAGAAAASPRPQSTAAERNGRVMISPANRRRAREAGIDLAQVAGSGPGGRILRSDLDEAVGAGGEGGARGDAGADDGLGSSVSGADRGAAGDQVTEIKVIGLRRIIAERMSEAKRNIPHFAYVEELDVTDLESLRMHLNSGGRQSLSYLPFVVAALTRVLRSFPQCNALYDSARGVLVQHGAVHVGIATQTPDGLKVPVVRNAQALGLWELSAEIRRLADRARTNKATREELSGSTITVTSLGKLGGIVSTPIINAPEVAIIGLNKAVERPVVRDGAVTVRRIMNLSSSFDHRFVDGYDAAAMIQALKELLEHPAAIFIPKAESP